MISVYCQHTVSGFKIFNTLTFPHSRGNDLFVRMGEISQSLKQEQQELVVTSKSLCGLAPFAVKLFGSRDTETILLKERHQTVLFLSHSDSDLAYAFVTDQKDEAQILRNMVCLWVKDRNALIPQLQTMTEKVIVGDELVLMFHKGVWDTLCEELKKNTTNVDATLLPVLQGKKNLIVNNVVGKGRILTNLGITQPLSSFVSLPGNDTVASMERRQRMIGYAIAGAAVGVCIIGGIVWCCGTK